MNGTPPVYHQATVQFLKRADTNVLMIVRSDKYYRKYVVPYLYDFCQLSSDITFNVTQQIVKVKDRKGALYFKSYELNRIQGLIKLVCDTREKEIKKALIELGWTPPKHANKEG